MRRAQGVMARVIAVALALVLGVAGGGGGRSLALATACQDAVAEVVGPPRGAEAPSSWSRGAGASATRIQAWRPGRPTRTVPRWTHAHRPLVIDRGSGTWPSAAIGTALLAFKRSRLI